MLNLDEISILKFRFWQDFFRHIEMLKSIKIITLEMILL